MNYSLYRFTLDLQRHQSNMSIPVFQYDSAVKLIISLTDGGKRYLINKGCHAIFYGKRPDGVPLCLDCEIPFDETDTSPEIVFEFNDTVTAELGNVSAQIRLYDSDNKIITAPKFLILVEERVVGNEDIEIADSTLDGIDKIILEEEQRKANEERREANFASVFIRYADNPRGENSSTEYSEGLNYIGIARAKEEPADESGYEWCKFVGSSKRVLNGDGGGLNLTIADSMVYYISNYSTVIINAPSMGDYTAHVFIDFPIDSDARLILPEGLSVEGSPVADIEPGDKWELGIDSVGGILSFRKR